MNGLEIKILIVASFLIIELLIIAIRGIIKKEVDVRRTVLKVIIAPVHWIAKLIFSVMDWLMPDIQKDKGLKAVTGSIGLLALAFFMIIFFWYSALFEFDMISQGLYSILVQASMLCIIFGLPITLWIVHKRLNENGFLKKKSENK